MKAVPQAMDVCWCGSGCVAFPEAKQSREGRPSLLGLDSEQLSSMSVLSSGDSFVGARWRRGVEFLRLFKRLPKTKIGTHFRDFSVF